MRYSPIPDFSPPTFTNFLPEDKIGTISPSSLILSEHRSIILSQDFTSSMPVVTMDDDSRSSRYSSEEDMPSMSPLAIADPHPPQSSTQHRARPGTAVANGSDIQPQQPRFLWPGEAWAQDHVVRPDAAAQNGSSNFINHQNGQHPQGPPFQRNGKLLCEKACLGDRFDAQYPANPHYQLSALPGQNVLINHGTSLPLASRPADSPSPHFFKST